MSQLLKKIETYHELLKLAANPEHKEIISQNSFILSITFGESNTQESRLSPLVIKRRLTDEVYNLKMKGCFQSLSFGPKEYKEILHDDRKFFIVEIHGYTDTGADYSNYARISTILSNLANALHFSYRCEEQVVHVDYFEHATKIVNEGILRDFPNHESGFIYGYLDFSSEEGTNQYNLQRKELSFNVKSQSPTFDFKKSAIMGKFSWFLPNDFQIQSLEALKKTGLGATCATFDIVLLSDRSQSYQEQIEEPDTEHETTYLNVLANSTTRYLNSIYQYVSSYSKAPSSFAKYEKFEDLLKAFDEKVISLCDKYAILSYKESQVFQSLKASAIDFENANESKAQKKFETELCQVFLTQLTNELRLEKTSCLGCMDYYFRSSKNKSVLTARTAPIVKTLDYLYNLQSEPNMDHVEFIRLKIGHDNEMTYKLIKHEIDLMQRVFVDNLMKFQMMISPEEKMKQSLRFEFGALIRDML